MICALKILMSASYLVYGLTNLQLD